MKNVAVLLVVCALSACATGSQPPSAQDLTNPAHVGRRQMLADQAEAEGLKRAELDTAPLRMSAAEVQALIKRDGTVSASRLFFGDSRRSTLCGLPLLDSIATGDSLWLAVARSMLPRQDICTMYGIRQAIQEALVKAPARVLTLLVDDANVDFDWTCSSMISDDFGHRSRMDALNSAHVAQVEAALTRVQAPSYVKLREACLTRLHEPPTPSPAPSSLARSSSTDAMADSILRTIARDGAGAGVQRVVPNGHLPEAYRARIASGDTTWLMIAIALGPTAALVPTLQHGMNSSWGYYALVDAVADALTVAPDAVLSRLVQYPAIPFQWICGGGTDDTEQARANATARRARAIPAVEKTNGVDYTALRDACLTRLRT